VDLTPADAKTKYHVARLLRDWQRSGIEKDDTTRKKILSVQNQLTKAGQQFSCSINEDSRVIKVNKAELEGCPARLPAQRVLHP
jgi:thimet oligopeptidase